MLPIYNHAAAECNVYVELEYEPVEENVTIPDSCQEEYERMVIMDAQGKTAPKWNMYFGIES